MSSGTTMMLTQPTHMIPCSQRALINAQALNVLWFLSQPVRVTGQVKYGICHKHQWAHVHACQHEGISEYWKEMGDVEYRVRGPVGMWKMFQDTTDSWRFCCPCCLSFCLLVGWMTVTDTCGWHFKGRSETGQGTIDYSFGLIRITVWIQDCDIGNTICQHSTTKQWH